MGLSYREATVKSIFVKWRTKILGAVFIVNLALTVYTIPMAMSGPPTHHHGNIMLSGPQNLMHIVPNKTKSNDNLVLKENARRIQLITQVSNLTEQPVDPLLAPFPALLSPWAVSCHNNTFLLVAVSSAVQNLDLRQAIRDTWGSISKTSVSVSLMFLLGLPGPDVADLQDYVEQENRKYGDVLQEAYVDHYANLSVKSLSMLRWTSQHCPSAKYLLKTDDDIFINLPNLFTVLTQQLSAGQRPFVLGHVIKGARPIASRLSKWYTPTALFPQRVYPTYLSGTAYVITASLVTTMVRVAMETKIFWLEDVYMTGMLATRAGASLVHSARFGYVRRHRDPCVYKQMVTAHELSAADLLQMWRDIHQPGLQCATSTMNFLAKVSITR